VGVFIGDRSRQAAKGLWQSLSAVHASVPSATQIFGKLMSRCYQESGRKVVGKETGQTSYPRALQQHPAPASWAIGS